MTQDAFARDLAAALATRPRSISPKYFYDAEGSRLFDRICELPEYYPTRTELAILLAPVALVFGPLPWIVEPLKISTSPRRAGTGTVSSRR